MRNNSDTYPILEPALYLAAFTLALVLRLADLGRAPLNDAEAAWALEALRFAAPGSGPAAGYGSQALYILLTGSTFILAGVTDFLARLWPALLSALPIWAAHLFRRDLGRMPALILAFGLALDPGLTIIARQIGSPAAAIALTLLALGLWRERRMVAAGVSAGLAVLAGPPFWAGMIGLLPALWLRRRLRREASPAGLTYEWQDPTRDDAPAEPTRAQKRSAAIAAAITLAAAGSGLLLRPQLLASIFGGPVDYIRTWTAAPSVASLTLLIALLVFQPFALGFGLLRALRLVTNWKEIDPADRTLDLACGVWAALALVLALVTPGRQTADLGWVLVPLWVLAAREIGAYAPAERPHPMAYLQAGLVIFLGSFFWLTLITREQVVAPNVSWLLVQIIVLAGIVVLGVLTTSLVALGWSWETARDGTLWGFGTLLLVYSVGALWGAAFLRPNRPEELWGTTPGPGQARLLQATLDELSLWNRGLENEIEIVSTVDQPSMRWALVKYPNARFSERAPEALQPAVVITAGRTEIPELTAAYRGQDFVWETLPGWPGAIPPGFKDWLAFRRAPIGQNYVILWARTDLFPGENASGQTP